LREERISPRGSFCGEIAVLFVADGREVAISRIFINYRREDSSPAAGRLHDALGDAFGFDNLFIDVDNTPVGSTSSSTFRRKFMPDGLPGSRQLRGFQFSERFPQ
jgi:hypothetical protein